MARLTDGLGGGGGSPVDLLAWCDEANARPLMRRMERWYFVRKVDGVEMIDCLTGADGANVHRELGGVLPDFAGWPEARMGGYRKWLRSVAAAGSYGEV